MKLGPLWVAILLASSGALAHEEDFPLPLLAQETAVPQTSAETTPTRPRQQAGQGLPLRPTRHIRFDTDEGTWMSVDRSPEGSHLVFDLLGDLYTLDAAGGRATAITRGLGFDTQPTYSPDGQWIAFVSDRSGAENLWAIRPDGSGAKQISFGDDDTVLSSPAWTPDGKALYVSRFRWSLNNYELWRYDLDGAETLVVPIKSAEQGRDAAVSSLGAVVTPDGRSIYFARRTGNPDEGKWSIVRRDVTGGAEQTIVPEPLGPGRSAYTGMYFRPVLSPDGASLVYATRFKGQTGLRLRTLATGEDRWLAFPIEHDQVGTRSWQDLAPRYAFTPDGKALLLSRRGKLERLPIDAGAPATPIPFTATIDQQLGPLTRVKVQQETGPVRVRLMQTPEQSPDGAFVAFSALGRIYVMPLSKGAAPRALTQSSTPTFHPSWSPDGRSIVYVTWTAKEGGQVWIAPVDGGAPRQLSDKAAFYTRPVFTPSGEAVLVVRSNQHGRLQTGMDYGSLRQGELVSWPAAGGSERVVYSGVVGGKPHFGRAKDAVYLQGPTGLVSVDLTSGESRTVAHVTGPGWYFVDGPVAVDDSRISPDGRWLLVQVAQQLHVLAMPTSDQPVDLSSPHLPHRRITAIGADFFEWADGGKTITWSIGSTFQRRALSDIRLNPAEQPSWLADAPSMRPGVNAFESVINVPRDTPRGAVLLRGARAITMRGDEVIENADVLVRDDRIAAVGARGTFAVPADAAIRDVSGRIILPGFIDIHDHVADVRRDILSTDSWGFRARLAYGITTSFDPSSLSIDMFAYQDLLDAGMVVGSRVPTTGMAMFSFNRLASLQEAQALLTRYRDYYRTRNVKQYIIGNRRQRQWLVQAAAQLGVMPTTEGSLALKLDLTQVLDGYSGSEHALPAPLYRDVVELVARSGTSYDCTLQIANLGPGAQDFFVARDRPFEDAKFMRLRPYAVGAGSVLSRPWTDPTVLLYPRVAGDAAKIQRAGGVVGIGSHGEIPGFGFHWEMEAHVQGGMTPHEALRAGTIGSAEAIGRAAEFGSIEPGKFADLAILDADPRADIRNSRSVVQVMKNGRLYDAVTLNELWPRQQPLAPAWFVGEEPAPR
ncbi:MAG TPA: amidohydrolase family protein [Steroidobacteraceae bacterium]|jgi:Tol biopolymer transport system component/predicted amidohydrolase|nr:amidohydrolase family protein [Steroidobacteraceae bacterium]